MPLRNKSSAAVSTSLCTSAVPSMVTYTVTVPSSAPLPWDAPWDSHILAKNSETPRLSWEPAVSLSSEISLKKYDCVSPTDSTTSYFKYTKSEAQILVKNKTKQNNNPNLLQCSMQCDPSTGKCFWVSQSRHCWKDWHHIWDILLILKMVKDIWNNMLTEPAAWASHSVLYELCFSGLFFFNVEFWALPWCQSSHISVRISGQVLLTAEPQCLLCP